MNRNLKSGLYQAGSILIISVLCGFIYNSFNSHKLPIIASPPLTSESDPRAINIAEARRIFEEGRAIFIDARSPADYGGGHIPGAINIYAETFKDEEPEEIKDIPYETMLIIYCDGDECALSRRLADALKTFGYENIKILYAGWKGWLDSETK